jgi:hypothetical protein
MRTDVVGADKLMAGRYGKEMREPELSALPAFEPKMFRGMQLRRPATIPSAPLVVRQRLTLAIPA